MLEQTKNMKQELTEAGIIRKDIKIRYVWSRMHGCKTSIHIQDCEKYIKFIIIRKLLKSGYGVIISNKQHLMITTDYQLRGLTIVTGNDIKTIAVNH
jgi:hypothetical protein